jgi:DNA-binding HxlR family transcriptional regulator
VPGRVTHEFAPPAEAEVRAGGRVLSVFENPLNVRVLRAHAYGGPLRLSQLQKKVGWSAQATVRSALDNLREVGALSKQSVGTSNHGVATELTATGEEMLFVGEVLEAWLERHPDGPIALDSEQARGAVKALAGGWSTALLRALARGPSSLSELHMQLPEVSYPTLERRLNWMRITGQIEPVERKGRGTPFAVTDWLRYAMAPVSAAGRCERRHLADSTSPITEIEIETAFLLTLPLVPLPETARGTCLVASRTELVPADEEESGIAGVAVGVDGGRVLSCSAEIETQPGTWAVASPEAWLEAVIDGGLENLRVGGADPQLALDLALGCHLALFMD